MLQNLAMKWVIVRLVTSWPNCLLNWVWEVNTRIAYQFLPILLLSTMPPSDQKEEEKVLTALDLIRINPGTKATYSSCPHNACIVLSSYTPPEWLARES
jgi:hypothetical protein